jgi:hypothetical protein
LDTLTCLEELWLGKNKITELRVCLYRGRLSTKTDNRQNLSTLQNLRILSIQSNRLTSLAGLESLSNLEELYVSHNALLQLTGLEHNCALRVLDISNNKLTSLANISHLQALEEFWASSNLFESFDEFEQELGQIKALTTVYFEGNPVQLNNRVTYRNKIRLALPQVKQIDAGECFLVLLEQVMSLRLISICASRIARLSCIHNLNLIQIVTMEHQLFLLMCSVWCILSIYVSRSQ